MAAKSRISAKDIPDLAMLDAVVEDPRRRCPDDPDFDWACWWTIAEHDFPDIPEKVVHAKLRQLLKRKLIDGCRCGCRGDFELTEKGKDFLRNGR